jgi:hypothetical protein
MSDNNLKPRKQIILLLNLFHHLITSLPEPHHYFFIKTFQRLFSNDFKARIIDLPDLPQVRSVCHVTEEMQIEKEPDF